MAIKYTSIATRKNVAKWLDVDPIKLAHWRKEGMPKTCSVKHGWWDIKQICEWIIGKKQKSPVKTKAIEILAAIIEQGKGKIVEAAPEKKKRGRPRKNPPAVIPDKPADKPKDDPKLELDDQEGFEGCVSRARSFELQMALLVQEKFNESPLLAADLFTTWQKAQDALLKLEKQLDDILLKRQSVVNIDEAAEIFFAMMGPVKARFKSLGPDLSLDLAGMDKASEISTFITDNVRIIFQEISKGKIKK